MYSAAITSVAKSDFNCGALFPADRCICRYLLPGSLDGVVLIPTDSAPILLAQLNGAICRLNKKTAPRSKIS